MPHRHLHPGPASGQTPDVDRGPQNIVDYIMLAFDAELQTAGLVATALPVGCPDALVSMDRRPSRASIQYSPLTIR